jgi:cell division transport system permease protein
MSKSFDHRRWKPAPLLPRQDGRDVSLVFVIAVLCFLACLMAIGGIGADRAAQGWGRQLKSSATVIVRATISQVPDAVADQAVQVLVQLPGVRSAKVQDKSETEALLAPWLGQDSVLEDLPVPRLVNIQLDALKPASAKAMAAALKSAGIDVTVDDHTLWMKDIGRAGDVARALALASFALMALSAAAVITFATRAGMVMRHQIVELLHLTGAEDRFIAELFQTRFASMGFVAGLLGAAAAAGLAAVVRTMGGAEGLTPILPIAWSDLLVTLPCPLIAALVAAIAARLTTLGLLRVMP